MHILYIIQYPCITTTLVKDGLPTTPAQQQPHQTPILLLAQFLSVSTLGLIYNNKQLPSITFNCFPFKKRSFQTKIYGWNANEGSKSSCPNTLKKWTALCPLESSQFLHPPVPSSISRAYLLQCLPTSYAGNNKLCNWFSQKYCKKQTSAKTLKNS